jgi:hypothetical protein
MTLCYEVVDLFVHRANLKGIADAKAWMLRPKFDGMVHIPALEHRDSAQLLLGFGVWTIRHEHVAPLGSQSLGSRDALKRFTTHHFTLLMKRLL